MLEYVQKIVNGSAGFFILGVLVFPSTYYVATLVPDMPVTSQGLAEDASDFEKAEYYFSPENYDLAKARQYYEASIRVNPEENIFQWYQLARINFIQGEFDTALHNLDKQVESHEDAVPNVYYMYGLIYGFRADLYDRTRDFELAEENFNKFLEYFPTNVWGRIDLSWIHFSQRDFKSMLTALDPVYAEEQDNPWFLNMYGLALMNTGDLDQAVKHLIRAKELSKSLVPEDWSKVYPGNNPKDYQTGLDEFMLALQLNLDLAKTKFENEGAV